MKSPFASKALQIASLVLVIQGALFYSASRGEIVPDAAPLSGFPAQVGPWKLAQQGVIDQETMDVLRADDLLTRWYVAPGSGGANLFVAFFKSQRAGQSPHSPKNCLPGSGWQPSENSRVDALVQGEQPIRINQYVVAKGDEQSVVLYWYQSHGRVIADEFAAKFYLVADSIRTHRSDTALVRVVVPVANGNTKKAIATGMEFVSAMYPTVRNYLPR